MTNQSQAQWISVDERLPNFNGDIPIIPIVRVLIAVDGKYGFVGEASYYPESKIFNRGGEEAKPSHWQPLPEPPR